MDLVFVLDSSTSVGASNFALLKEFVKDMIDFTDIDSGAVRVGLVIYSTDVLVEFYLDEYITKADVKNAIDRLSYITGTTNTAEALMRMYGHVYSPTRGDRGDAENIGVTVINRL